MKGIQRPRIDNDIPLLLLDLIKPEIFQLPFQLALSGREKRASRSFFFPFPSPFFFLFFLFFFFFPFFFFLQHRIGFYKNDRFIFQIFDNRSVHPSIAQPISNHRSQPINMLFERELDIFAMSSGLIYPILFEHRSFYVAFITMIYDPFYTGVVPIVVSGDWKFQNWEFFSFCVVERFSKNP